jgi:hypothetical protein
VDGDVDRVSDGGPGSILAALAHRGIEFVVIGGLAAVAHGARRMTRDIDIVVAPDDGNLALLERALADLDAVALGESGAERAIEPADVAMVALGTTLHTRTSGGRLDIVGAPAGAAPFDQLRRRAIRIAIASRPTLVAGLDDLIAMKRASGRPLDLQDIAEVTAVEQRGRSGPDRDPAC